MVPNVRCLHHGTPRYLAEIDLDKSAFSLLDMPAMRWETHERGGPHGLGIAANSGCQREKLGEAPNPRHRPYIKFWKDPRDELMLLGSFSQRGQKFQTDSKPVVLHALTINDACLGTEARPGRA